MARTCVSFHCQGGWWRGRGDLGGWRYGVRENLFAGHKLSLSMNVGDSLCGHKGTSVLNAGMGPRRLLAAVAVKTPATEKPREGQGMSR